MTDFGFGTLVARAPAAGKPRRCARRRCPDGQGDRDFWRVAFRARLVYARCQPCASCSSSPSPFASPAFAAGEAPEQTVTAIEPQGEQRVEPVPPPPEQEVAALDPQSEQQVTSGQKGGVRRGFETAGKVALGVLAAGVSVGVMLAELILL